MVIQWAGGIRRSVPGSNSFRARNSVQCSRRAFALCAFGSFSPSGGCFPCRSGIELRPTCAWSSPFAAKCRFAWAPNPLRPSRRARRLCPAPRRFRSDCRRWTTTSSICSPSFLNFPRRFWIALDRQKDPKCGLHFRSRKRSTEPPVPRRCPRSRPNPSCPIIFGVLSRFIKIRHKFVLLDCRN